MTTRKQIANVFRKAKECLAHTGADIGWNPGRVYKNEFICLSIDDTNCSARAMTMAKKVISDRLGRYNTVEEYVRNVLRIKESQRTKNRLQAYRHAWVDSLIEEFSK